MRILLLTPFQEPTRERYVALLSTVLARLGAELAVVEAADSPAGLLGALHSECQRASAVVACLDLQRPNVIFEIGFARASGHRPIVLTPAENYLGAFVEPEDVIVHGGRLDRVIGQLADKIAAAARAQVKGRQLASSYDLARTEPALIEALARTVHDRWLAQRVSEGWTYGRDRNDALKTHPGIIGYDKLSESEKDYDRQTALATLGAMLSMGYHIGQK